MGRMDKGYQKLLAVSGARLGTWLPNPNLWATWLALKKVTASTQKTKTVRGQRHCLPSGARGTSTVTLRLQLRRCAACAVDRRRPLRESWTGRGAASALSPRLLHRRRRRCPPLLSTLSDAMRLAEYELGVTIELNDHGPYSVNNIAPGSGRPFPEGHALAQLNGRLTKEP